MAFDTSTDQENRQFRHASPTLLIGLGGTGAEVLSRVRDRFFSGIGPLEDFPVVRYLWLDTDTVQSTHVSSWYKRHRQIAQQLKFQPNEKVELTVPDTEAYLSHLSLHPHIQRWIYPHLSGKTSITEGAGQIRAYGRLALFHNVDMVRTRLDLSLRQITAIDAARRSQENGLPTNAGSLNVILVGSLAGGTGSGTFLDMAYLVRRQLRELGGTHKVTLMGFLVLPSVFGGTSDMTRLYANGYAALKELNHFNYSPPAERENASSDTERTKEHDFQYWFSSNETPETTSLPPFDICYLVDGRNLGGATASGAPLNDTIFSMIAEAVYHDFSLSDFGTAKRSSRDNLLQWLGKQAKPLYESEEGELKLPKRHFAFGMATITFPYDRVRRACSAKLASDIVDYWLRKSDDEMDAPNFLNERFLNALQFQEFATPGVRAQKRDVLDNMYSLGGGRTLQQALIEQVGAMVRDVRDMGSHRSGMPWSDMLRERVASMDRDWNGERSEDPRQWGQHVLRMRTNQETYLKDLKGRLDGQIEGLVNNEHRGIGFAMAVLDALTERVTREEDGYIDTWRKEQRQAQEQMAALRDELEGYIQQLDEQWRMSNWHFLRGTTLEKTLDKFEEAATNFYQARVRVLARTLAVEVAEKVLQMISRDDRHGWLYRLARLQRDLGELKALLAERVEAYSEATPDTRQILLYNGAEDLKRIYSRYVSKPELVAKQLNEDALRALELRLMDLPHHSIDLNALCDRLVRVTAGQFSTLHEDYDAFTLFHEKYPVRSPEWHEKIDEILKACRCWITWEVGHTGVKDTIKPDQARFILGLAHNGDDSRYKTFADTIMERFADAGQRQTVKLGSRHQIVFYYEVAGYALCQTASVRTMREQYLKVLADGTRDLHTDKKDARFAELVVLNREEKQQLAQGARGFLLGSILGIIKPVPWRDGRLNEDITYEYMEKIPGLSPESRLLGNDNAVIPYLRSKKDSLLLKINEEITWLRGMLLDDPISRAEYAAVLRLWLESYYKPRQVDVGNGVTEVLTAMEWRVLKDEHGQVMKDATAEFVGLVDEKFAAIGSHKDNFTAENLSKRRVLKVEQATKTPSRVN